MSKKKLEDSSPLHEKWMKFALKQAHQAYKKNEVPIGAILIQNNKIIARGHNLSISKKDPTAHAEIICLRKAGKRLKNYRLGDTILYTTVEPCAMCAGACIWARINTVVYGCSDSKAGACGSVIDLSQQQLNHHFKTIKGILNEDCRFLIQDFFKAKRTIK